MIRFTLRYYAELIFLQFMLWIIAWCKLVDGIVGVTSFAYVQSFWAFAAAEWFERIITERRKTYKDLYQ